MHSDETLVKLLREGWRGATSVDLMLEAADRIERLARDRDEWRRRCAEETIAWVDAVKRADVAESFWHAAEDECRAVQSRLDAILEPEQMGADDAR